MILGLLFGNSMLIQAAADQDDEQDDAEQKPWVFIDEVPDMQMQQQGNGQMGEAEDDAEQNVQAVGEIDDGNLMSNTMDTEEDINTFENRFLELLPSLYNYSADGIYARAAYPLWDNDLGGGHKDYFVSTIAQKINVGATYENIKDELMKDVCIGMTALCTKMGKILFKDGYYTGYFGRLIKLAQRRDRQDVANLLKSYAVDEDGNSLCCSWCDYIGSNKQRFDQHPNVMHSSYFKFVD